MRESNEHRRDWPSWSKRTGIAVACLTLGFAAALAAFGFHSEPPSVDSEFDSSALIFGTAAAVLFATSVLTALTGRDDRTDEALIRLDWFLPALRQSKPDQSASKSWPGRVLRALIPAKWQSDRSTKRRGRLRKALRAIGSSWLQSPVRRICQAVCLTAFLVLFFYVCWPYTAQPGTTTPIANLHPYQTLGADSDTVNWPSHYADDLAEKEKIAAESFLVIDPLVSLSTAVASRSWVWSLACAGAILLVCVLIPRGFCGYICPLGTTIDLFDWAIGKRVTRLRVPDDGWWVHIKYYLLGGVLVAAIFGVLLSGFVAAIPVVTRGMLFLLEPLQVATLRGPHLVPPLHAGHVFSIALFFAVLGLGFLRPRFWCKYVCPSGAVFSLGNLFRAVERKVESSCIHCNKCVEVCPFDAIKPDFTTRTTDCTLCQTCAGVCPTHAIKFVERTNLVQLKVENQPPTKETAIGRRGFLSLATGSVAAAAGGAGLAKATSACGALLDRDDSLSLIRPPGSVPEEEFLQMCIRCDECLKACPNNVLQPEGFEQGLEGLWAPMADPNWAGCDSSCNACGQVCPTGAIRALPLEEKRYARMGLAIVNEQTCLPMAGKEECDLCVQECDAAGYNAIEFIVVGTESDEEGNPIEGTGFHAPNVIADACVGCGLCQTRCVAINVKERGVLDETAILVEAGPGKEDRLMTGSYVELQKTRLAERASNRSTSLDESYFVPPEDPQNSPPSQTEPAPTADDPFGLGSDLPSENDDPFGLN